MTDEEKAIKKLCIKCSSYDFCKKGNQLHCAETVAYIKGLAEGRKEVREHETTCVNRLHHIEKENEQLKKEISVLLSCSSCSENKGGYVCEKEYNDKCLAQKIEYIKELKEEITELKAQNEGLKHCENCKHYMCFAHEEPCISCCLLYKDEKENKWEKAE